MTTRPPDRLFALGRWLLERRLPAHLADEADGDLRELWARRAATGQRRLTLAYLVDLAGLVVRRRRRMVHALDARRPFLPQFLEVIDMRHDLRYAVRLIRRQPLGAALTVITLALGIAASTGIFTTVDRLLLQPLPYPEPERLMAVRNAPFSFAGSSMDIALGIRTLGVFDGIGVYAEGGLNSDVDGTALRLPAAVASPGFFEAMAVTPQIGRVYTYEDTTATDNAIAVISDGLWRRLFGADQSVLEQPLYVNRRAFRIAGVMPSGFTFPGTTDVWIPVFSDRQATGSTFAPDVVGRLAAGVTPEAAAAAIDRLKAGRGAPSDDAERPRVTPLQAELTGAVRPTLLLLASCVGLVLLVATTNVAGLLLARVTQRQSEYVLRRALGGSRWRLVRLLAVEAVVLAGLAGMLGTIAGSVALKLVATLSASALPPMALGLDVRMLAIALLVSVTTGLLFGLVPGLAAASQPPAGVVRATSTATAGPGWRRFRQALVVVQVAAALVLLAVTSMTIQTMIRLSRIDLGFRGDSVLGLTLTLPLATYDGAAAVSQFADRALERLRAVPGVVRAGATGALPGDRTVGVGLRIYLPGERARGGEGRSASLLMASPDYFDAMRIHLVSGRTFTEADRRRGAPVVILSASAARMLWPDGRNPVGLVAEIGVPPEPVNVEVVGIVADVMLRGPLAPWNQEQMYRPVAQHPPFGGLSFAVRTTGDPAAIAPAVRRALTELDPALPAYNVRALDAVASEFLSSHRLALMLLATFAALTLVLAAVGLYGVLAHLVAARTRELGIRMALGADGGRLQRGVVLSGLRLAGTGVLVGLLLVGAAARAIAAFVPDLDPLPWQAVGLAAALMIAVATVAAWLPARRAARIDVAGTLRA
jgi:predicted permease